jgi:hypothetical protein
MSFSNDSATRSPPRANRGRIFAGRPSPSGMPRRLRLSDRILPDHRLLRDRWPIETPRWSLSHRFHRVSCKVLSPNLLPVSFGERNSFSAAIAVVAEKFHSPAEKPHFQHCRSSFVHSRFSDCSPAKFDLTAASSIWHSAPFGHARKRISEGRPGSRRWPAARICARKKYCTTADLWMYADRCHLAQEWA